MLLNEHTDVSTQIERLQIGPDDLIVLRCDQFLTNEAAARLRQCVREMMDALGKPDNLILVLESDMTIEALDEAVMREHGWVREKA